MKTKFNYILGSGIAGLITAFYNNTFVIISENFGGQVNSSFPMGPRYIKKTEYTKQLLDDLNIKAKIKKVRVGYYYQGSVHNSIPFLLKQEYYEKSRGLVSNSLAPSSTMSDGDSTFEAYDIPMSYIVDEIMLKLLLERRIINAKILKLDLKHKTITSNSGIENYDKLVSTIALPIFKELIIYKNSETIALLKCLRYSPITFILYNRILSYNEKYDYIYYPEKIIPFNRVTKYNDNFIAEITGDYYIQNYKNISILRIGQIQPLPLDINIKDIKFIGRYAQWKHNIRLSEVIKLAKEFNNGQR